MSHNALKKLVVLDPALIAAGGHHTGFALMAARSLVERRLSMELEFVCNHSIADSIKNELERYGCRVRPEFHFNFYAMFEQDARLAESQSYIRQAAKEYAQVARKTLESSDAAGLVFFHPSLSWEHAQALSLALRSVGAASEASHIVCAMFNPGTGHNRKTLNSMSKLHFRLAFGALQAIPNVQIFASDYELAEKYGSLLDRQEPLPIHPCYLADWQQLKEEQRATQFTRNDSPIKILLYLGDAKFDKGFSCLPKVAHQILLHTDSNVELQVHFNNPWENQEIRAVSDQLRKTADKDMRLSIQEGFLSDRELHKTLQEADLLLLNYDSCKYMEKSSGVLWLAAYHLLPVCILQRSWLSREAFRLGVRTFSLKDVKKNLAALLVEKKDIVSSAQSKYRKTIYRSFWHWLFSTVMSKECGDDFEEVSC